MSGDPGPFEDIYAFAARWLAMRGLSLAGQAEALGVPAFALQEWKRRAAYPGAPIVEAGGAANPAPYEDGFSLSGVDGELRENLAMQALTDGEELPGFIARMLDLGLMAWRESA